MFKEKDRDEEKFRTYYERRRNRKNSLWHCVWELAPFIIFGQIFTLGPVILTFLYSRELGPWWWILLILYEIIVSVLVYLIYRYRTIVELRGYFSQEEFNREFAKEMWLIRIMEKLSGFLVN